MQIRRVVTGQVGSKSVIVSDGPSPKTFASNTVPNAASALLWATPATPSLPHSGRDSISLESSLIPEVGGTRLVLVTFPPDSIFTNPNLDLAAYAAENAAFAPEFMRHFEAAEPGMHTTKTVDYGIVVRGEIWLEVDDGQLVQLHPGDVVVQNGTRHAWRNKSAEPATIAFVLIGAAA